MTEKMHYGTYGRATRRSNNEKRRQAHIQREQERRSARTPDPNPTGGSSRAITPDRSSGLDYGTESDGEFVPHKRASKAKGIDPPESSTRSSRTQQRERRYQQVSKSPVPDGAVTRSKDESRRPSSQALSPEISRGRRKGPYLARQVEEFDLRKKRGASAERTQSTSLTRSPNSDHDEPAVSSTSSAAVTSRTTSAKDSLRTYIMGKMPILPILGSSGCKKRSRRFGKRRSIETRSRTNYGSEDGSVTYLNNNISDEEDECSYYETSDEEDSLEDEQSHPSNKDRYYESDREDSYSDEEDSYVSEQSGRSQFSRRSGRSQESRRSVRYSSDLEESNSQTALSLSSHSHASTQHVDPRSQAVRLLGENEALRLSVNVLRSDFEVMLKQMNGIEGAVNDADSIASESSRISVCLRKIERLKIQAFRKFQEREVAERQSLDAETKELIKMRIQPYKECIDDLLTENERLYELCSSLTQEREVILEEVNELRRESKSGTGDSGVSRLSGMLLTDEKAAKVHSECMTSLASLLEGINTCVEEGEKEKAGTMGREIMGLVSKIMSQQQIIQVMRDSTSSESYRADAADDVGVTSKVENASNHPEKSVEVFSVCTVETASDDSEEETPNASKALPNRLHKEAVALKMKQEEQHEHDRSSDESTVEIIYEYDSDTSSDYNVDEDSLGQVEYFTDDEDVEISGNLSYSCPSPVNSRYCPSLKSSVSVSSSQYSTSNVSCSTVIAGTRSRPSPVSSHTTSTDEEVEMMMRRDGNKACTYYTYCSSRAPSIKECASKDENPLDGNELLQTERAIVTEYNIEDENCYADYEEELCQSHAEDERRLTEAINSHLGQTNQQSMFFRVDTPSVCRSMSASDSFGSVGDCPSHGSESTRERKGISITVVSRSSSHCSFPSSCKHTYVTFFKHGNLKCDIDAILEEQFTETREAMQSMLSIATDAATYRPQNDQPEKMKKMKYQGEFNFAGERHGYGIYTSKNGNEYRGEWLNGEREGLGVVKVGNGDIFEGQFEGNRKQGIGVYYYSDGECDLSLYRDDARFGDSLRYSTDRKVVYLLSDDMGSKEISLNEAAEVAKGLGCIVGY